MHTNATVVKTVKTNKSLDLTKPKYKPNDQKHSWQRTDKRLAN